MTTHCMLREDSQSVLLASLQRFICNRSLFGLMASAISSRDCRTVLSVGQICADLITIADSYPKEDEQVLVEAQYWQKGGNAGNFSEVLSHLGTRVEFFGTFPDVSKMKPAILGGSAGAKYCLAEMDRLNVEYEHLAYRDCPDFPSTASVLSKDTGARTIACYRGPLDELTIEDFSVLNLKSYSWVHFEGRDNVEVIRRAISLIHQDNLLRSPKDRTRISVELELPQHNGLMSSCPLVDLVVVSRYYAQHLGYETPLECVSEFRTKLKPGGEVVCSWGDVGAACAKNIPGDEAHLVPAVEPEKVVDTLGAGDTFQAALIHAILNELHLRQSVQYACNVSSRKIASRGYDSVKGMGLSTYN